ILILQRVIRDFRVLVERARVERRPAADQRTGAGLDPLSADRVGAARYLEVVDDQELALNRVVGDRREALPERRDGNRDRAAGQRRTLRHALGDDVGRRAELCPGDQELAGGRRVGERRRRGGQLAVDLVDDKRGCYELHGTAVIPDETADDRRWFLNPGDQASVARGTA